MDQLTHIRKEIDTIDSQLLELISRRVENVKEIGRIKKERKKPIRDLVREAEKLETLKEKAKVLGIPDTFVKEFWQILFKLSYLIEK